LICFSGHKILTFGLGASFAFSRKINMVVKPQALENGMTARHLALGLGMSAKP